MTRTGAAVALLMLSGCSPPLAGFQAALARHDSATAALGEWCRARGIASPATIRAIPVTGDEVAVAAAPRGDLGVGPEEPLGYRHVRLACGDTVLSDARNWFVPARLTPEMNAVLAASQIPFGKVVAPLGFRRERLEERAGPLPGCPDDTVLAHRAVLRLADGRAISVVTECYTRENLAPR